MSIKFYTWREYDRRPQSLPWYEVWIKVYFHPSEQSFREILADPKFQIWRAFLWTLMSGAIAGFMISLANYANSTLLTDSIFIWIFLGPFLATLALVLISLPVVHASGQFSTEQGKNRFVYCVAAALAPTLLGYGFLIGIGAVMAMISPHLLLILNVLALFLTVYFVWLVINGFKATTINRGGFPSFTDPTQNSSDSYPSSADRVTNDSEDNSPELHQRLKALEISRDDRGIKQPWDIKMSSVSVERQTIFGEAAHDYKFILMEIISGACLILFGGGYLVNVLSSTVKGDLSICGLSFIGFGIGIYFLLRDLNHFRNAKRLHDRSEVTSGMIRNKCQEVKDLGENDEGHHYVITIFLIEYEFCVSFTRYVIRQRISRLKFNKLQTISTIKVRYLPENPLISRMVS